MKYSKLGNSNLNVSRICMGCMGFGNATTGQHIWTLDEEQSREIIKRGLELGVNFYDTAIAYQNGSSEKFVGKALKDYAKRENVIVATKFLPRTQDEIKSNQTYQDSSISRI
jgi:1-deoxyxylulose-5-phosphate synthase